MKLPPWDTLITLATVAEHGSFREAAHRLGKKPSAISHRIRVLEDHLGVRVLHRTSRHVSLTPAGEVLVRAIHPARDVLEEAVDTLRQTQHVVQGRLRMNVPRVAAHHVLPGILHRLMERHPALRLEVVVNDGLLDLAEDAFDVGVRFRERLPPDSIAVPLDPPVQFGLFASAAYLEEHGRPTTPDDLQHHRAIGLRFPSGERYAWELEGTTFPGPFPIVLDDPVLVASLAARGQGIAYLATTAAQGLEPVLEAFWTPPEPLYLYRQGRRHPSGPVRALWDLVTGSG